MSPLRGFDHVQRRTTVPGKIRYARVTLHPKETVAPEGKNRHKSLHMVQLGISTDATAAITTVRNEFLKAFRWMRTRIVNGIR